MALYDDKPCIPAGCANPKPPYFLTAYEIAVKHGFRGTEEEWLESLTAFELAAAAGFEGTLEEWLELLKDPVPNIQIGEVTTLPAGSYATAKISGDKKNPKLDLGIPSGGSGGVTGTQPDAVYIGDAPPDRRNVLWFDTSGRPAAAEAGVMMLNLGEEGAASAVSIAVEDEEYPVTNVEASSGTGEPYDYTII